MCILAFIPIFSFALEIRIDPNLNEEVVFIQKKQAPPIELETTIFKPPGTGPFPVLIINHGKSANAHHFQPRERSLPVVREFLQRGYAVVLPMRQGFSKSTGDVIEPFCNLLSTGEEHAKDLVVVLKWLENQNWADTSEMIMFGQSHGGLTTLAYAQNPHPGIKLFVNFAGGSKYLNFTCDWKQSMKLAFQKFGQNTSVHSVWFYGENDSYFPPQIIQPAYEAYKQGNPNVELISFGPFGNDAHSMFGSYEGIPIWLPVIQRKLSELNLPSDIKYPQFALPKEITLPSASGFALVSEINKLPLKNNIAREGYKRWLNAASPKAFAIHPTNGSWGASWEGGGELPYLRALAICEKFAKAPCKLYAVDDRVVWDQK